MCNMVTKHYYDHADGMDQLENDRKIDKQLGNNRKPKLRSITNLTIICAANTFYCFYKSYLSKMCLLVKLINFIKTRGTEQCYHPTYTFAPPLHVAISNSPVCSQTFQNLGRFSHAWFFQTFVLQNKIIQSLSACKQMCTLTEGKNKMVGPLKCYLHTVCPKQ